ncbi:hypothetical protein GN278_06525 [Rhodobacteraceae bacterium Araon29]
MLSILGEKRDRRGLLNDFCRHIFLLFGTLVTFIFLRDYFLLNNAYLIDAVVVGLLGSYFKLQPSTKFFRFLFYSMVLICLFYILAAYPTLPSDIVNQEGRNWLSFKLYPTLSVFMCLGAFWRPTLLLVPICQIHWQKIQLWNMSGVHLSTTDYLTILEFGLLLVSGFLFVQFVALALRLKKGIQRNLFGRFFEKTDEEKVGQCQLSKLDIIAYFAVCTHMGNYLHSGIKKLRLGDDPFSWIIESQTQFLTVTTHVVGQLPITFGGNFFVNIYPFLENNIVVINFTTVILQLLCVFCVFKINWIKLITIAYDLQHVIIFLLSGIFFWKWIWLNTTIILGLRYLKTTALGVPLVLIGALLVVFSPLAFSIATLGWFETRAFNKAHFKAHTADGSSFIVPSNYFGSFSLTAAQQGIARPFEGHFETSTLANTQKRDTMLLAESCTLPTSERSKLANKKNTERMNNFIKNHHRYVLEKINEDGIWNYDLYPHHMWSNLASFNDFFELDKRKIVRYSYHVDSVCLSVINGVIEEKNVLSGSIEVEVTDV